MQWTLLCFLTLLQLLTLLQPFWLTVKQYLQVYAVYYKQDQKSLHFQQAAPFSRTTSATELQGA